ncbi:MAG: PfkB family carbohydrate kinase [Pseudomonadota bacterium]|nr:PfkB family carbohydrate kinase [Pseudomonadota bacterium]
MKRFSRACFVTGAHVDLAGRLAGAPILHVSNPGRVERQPGGAGLNAASVAVALGLDSAIAGPVGTDAAAGELKVEVRRRGITDALAAMHGRATGSYTAIMAPDGEMVIGLADLSIHEAADAGWLFARCGAALHGAGLWFLMTNSLEPTLEELSERGKADGKLLAAATITPAKAVRLRPVLGQLDLLFTNVAEARALTGLDRAGGRHLAEALAQSGVAAGAISAADGPLTWWRDGATGALQPPPVPRVADVNGAGDALAGATLAGLARGFGLDDALRAGIAAAQLTLGVPEPFHAGIDWPQVEALAAKIAPPSEAG